jgi:hypothetical protein
LLPYTQQNSPTLPYIVRFACFLGRKLIGIQYQRKKKDYSDNSHIGDCFGNLRNTLELEAFEKQNYNDF